MDDDDRDAINQAADLLYPTGDPRAAPWPDPATLGRIRSRLRGLADISPDANIAEARAAVLGEIDDMDPDGHMRAIMDEEREGDPGHAGNAWWRAFIKVAGMCRALNAIDEIDQ